MIRIHIYKRSQLNNTEEFNLRVRQASDKRRPASLDCALTKKQWSNLCTSAVLNDALSEYGLSEADVSIYYGEWGRPYLRDYPDIYFNISHSGEYYVCAIGDENMGVDIEQIDYKRDIIGIARRFFRNNEIEYILKGNTDKEQSYRFYKLWTCKESLVKLKGLSIVKEIANTGIIINDKGVRAMYKHTDVSCRFEEKVFDGCIMTLCHQNKADSFITS